MRLLTALLLTLLALPAAADEYYCADLWFTRNLVVHRAGYCFGTPLGQSIFGNEGCTGKSPVLSQTDAKMVAYLKQLERDEGCAVDTSQTSLSVTGMEARKQLKDLPVPTLFESGCVGWLGAVTPLYAGRSTGGTPIGSIRPGESVIFDFEEAGDWNFVRIYDENRLVSQGWARVPVWGEGLCEMMAG